ncbi:MAG TPA: hypothetical protein VKB87_07665 [Myxococcaceae bacterium]|nr:hypothetical protein [Myxococcaceae bacterium]
MRKMLKKATVTGAVTLFLLAVVSSARADNLQLFTTRAAFGGDDMVDWGQLGPCMTIIPGGFFARSTVLGLNLNGYFAGPGTGEVRVQTLCSWGGNFASGDVVVWTHMPGQGPLNLQFCEPLAGAGAQIQADFFGPFTARIEVFNGNTSLGAFTEDGNSTGAGDNSAIFIGVKDLDGANITSVIFSLTVAFSDPADFAINKLALDSGRPSPAPDGNPSTASGE